MCVVRCSYQFWCGAKRLTLTIFLNHFSLVLVLGQGLSLNLELMDLATLAGQQGPRIYMSVPHTLDPVLGL